MGRQSQRKREIDTVLNCLMSPAWEMHKLGDPKAPACYVLRHRGPELASPENAAVPVDSVAEHRFYVDPRVQSPEQTRDVAKFALKSLIAEQIVDALRALETAPPKPPVVQHRSSADVYEDEGRN